MYIYSELSEDEAMYAAKDSVKWLIQNLYKHKSSPLFLLPARVVEAANFDQKGDLSNQIYAFDNGMIMLRLLNLYKVTKNQNL